LASLSYSINVICKDRKFKKSTQYALFGFLFLLPTAPVYYLIYHQDINTDTGYSNAAASIIELAGENPTENITIMAWQGDLLEYYMKEKPRNLRLVDICYGHTCPDNQSLEWLKNGSVDYVLDYAQQPRFEATKTYLYIRGKYKTKETIYPDLLILRKNS
jgi:hypothetical protein